MIEQAEAVVHRGHADGDHVLVVTFAVSEDVLFAPDGRRRIVAHAAAAAGRAVDEALGSSSRMEVA